MKKIVKITANLVVTGVVNTNGNSPTHWENNKRENGMKLDNHVFAKTDREGRDFSSSGMIRKCLFSPNQPTIEPADSNAQDTFASSFEGLLRGYMFCTKSMDSVKRQSPLTVLDAYSEELCVFKENCTHSGERNSTSFFTKDNAPSRIQKLEMFLDLSLLSEVMNDERTGRAFNCKPEEFVALVNKNVGLGKEVASESTDGFSHVKINGEGMSMLIRNLFARIEGLERRRAGAILSIDTDTISIKCGNVSYESVDALIEDVKANF